MPSNIPNIFSQEIVILHMRNEPRISYGIGVEKINLFDHGNRIDFQCFYTTRQIFDSVLNTGISVVIAPGGTDLGI